MTNSELFAILQPHILNVSGVPIVILANQNADAPTGDYATIQVRTNISERGQANIKYTALDGDLVQTNIKPQMLVTCVVEFFRGDAHMYAQNLLQINRREDVVWSLFKKNISIRDTGAIKDLTALQSGNYEQRAHIEINLWMEEILTYTNNTILEVPISLENEKGVVIQSDLINLGK